MPSDLGVWQELIQQSTEEESARSWHHCLEDRPDHPPLGRQVQAAKEVAEAEEAAHQVAGSRDWPNDRGRRGAPSPNSHLGLAGASSSMSKTHVMN